MTVMTMTAPKYRFRRGALENIAHMLNLNTDERLAATLGYQVSDLELFRHGRKYVTAADALRIATMMGDSDYLVGWFDLVNT